MRSKRKRIRKQKKLRIKIFTGDFILVIATLILVLFGLIMVFSSSYYYSISKFGTAYTFLIRHGIWIILGLCAIAAGSAVDYRKYAPWAYFALIVTFVLLILVLTPAGENVNGASRWISLGPITIMPGEWAKLTAVLFTSYFLSRYPGRIDSLIGGILPLLLLTVVYGFLIIKQPNLSTAIIVCGIIIALMLVAGMKWKYLFYPLAAGSLGIAYIMMTKNTHWYDRIKSFLDPFEDPLGKGYQVVQSLLALGSGGLNGVGLGKSIQKTLYLPEPQNDFIAAIIGEELGFLGLMVLLVVYCIYIWRGFRIAVNAPDMFGMLIASGIVIMVAIQVILNIAVVTSSMPATGVVLPFISYGGNSLLIFMFATGVLLNISEDEKNNGTEDSGKEIR